MGSTTETLYDTDFYEWTSHTAELLRERRFDEVDLENLLEEIESLGKSQRKAVRSQLSRMLVHLAKAQIQPERHGSSWTSTILDARREIRHDLEDSPSLRRVAVQSLDKLYREAFNDALDETGLRERAMEFPLPERYPYTLYQLLEADLDTLLPR